ncbi:unnamed protein product [Closterium sp. NIES-54]
MQERVQRSTTGAGSSHSDVGGQRCSPRRSGVGPMSVTHASAGWGGGIAPAYGYFKFSPDTITVPKLLEGRHEFITWTGSIEPKLEIGLLKSFADGDVAGNHDQPFLLHSQSFPSSW